MNNKTREDLANYAHEAWSGWMKYLFSHCFPETKLDISCGVIYKTGDLVIPKWAVERWKRQMETEYKDLPEDEKKSDRKEADRIIKIIED